MGKFKMWVLVAIIASLSTTISQNTATQRKNTTQGTTTTQGPSMNCTQFSSIISDVQELIKYESRRDAFLEQMGFQTSDNIFGADPTYDTCAVAPVKNANLHAVAAQVFTNEYKLTLEQYAFLVTHCNAFESSPLNCTVRPTELPKYRPIDGRANNLNNPEWGAADTPFARFGPKRYEDGINTIKKSVTGTELPNARYLVQNILKNTVRALPPPLSYGVFALLTVLFITHDVHYQTPVQPSNSQNEVSCCSADINRVLPPYLKHSACLPIEVSGNDTFYQGADIGCLNLVRSQTVEYTNQVKPGEIMNRATSFLDLSLIYGNHQSELDKIRLFQDGLFRMGTNNVLPVDSNGQYIPSMRRFTMVPMASIWPSLFARNHNTLAKGLADLNPKWDDETLFQEARRINIATFQYNLITSKAVEDSISGIPINETYSADRNAATSLEFAIAYRSAHYYIHDTMLFEAEDGTEKRVLQSDTIGHIEMLENDFDGALRGALAEVVNAGPYGDEITNRIGKNSDGYGVDIIAVDIQRGRDQGLPSYLDVRRKCQLKPEVNTFDDFNQIFNSTNVDLLRKAYASPEDVDYYVGGLFEMFEILGNPLVGPTFGCVIAKQWDNFAGGDIYYYLNPTSPYPFTQPQIQAIQSYSISNLLCANSGMIETAQIWPYAPSFVNPLVSCSTWPAMNLTAWQV